MGTYDRKCNLSIYIALLSFIYSMKRKFFRNLGVAAVENSVRSRAAVEEAGVEAVAEDTNLSGVDGGGGDRRSRERRGLRVFWDKSETTQGGLLFIRLKISIAVLN
jgi:hypothetical protein